VWSHCPDQVEVCVKNFKIDSSRKHSMLEDIKQEIYDIEDTENVIGVETDNYVDIDPCSSSKADLFENKDAGKEINNKVNSLLGNSWKDDVDIRDNVVKDIKEDTSEDFCMDEVEDTFNGISSKKEVNSYPNSLQEDSCKDDTVFKDKIKDTSEDFCMDEVEDAFIEISSKKEVNSYPNSLQEDNCKDDTVFKDKIKDTPDIFCMDEVEDTFNEISSYDQMSDTESVTDKQGDEEIMNSFIKEDISNACSMASSTDPGQKESILSKEQIYKDKFNLMTKSVSVKLNKCKLDWNKEFLNYVESSLLDDNASLIEDPIEAMGENEENNDDSNDLIYNDDDTQRDPAFTQDNVKNDHDSKEVPNDNILKDTGQKDHYIIDATSEDQKESLFKNSASGVDSKIDNDILMMAALENNDFNHADVPHNDVILNSTENGDCSVKNDFCSVKRSVAEDSLEDSFHENTEVKNHIEKETVDEGEESLLCILEPVGALGMFSI
jgi:hypothetical protein